MIRCPHFAAGLRIKSSCQATLKPAYDRHMGFSRTQTIDVALTTSQVWDLLTDPGAWLQFDDQLQQFAPVDIAGERLQVGDTVKVVPKALIRGFSSEERRVRRPAT